MPKFELKLWWRELMNVWLQGFPWFAKTIMTRVLVKIIGKLLLITYYFDTYAQNKLQLSIFTAMVTLIVNGYTSWRNDFGWEGFFSFLEDKQPL